MLKTSTFLILGALAMGGCSSPQSKAKDADAAQHDANEEKAYASEEVRIKADEVQRKADEENAANAREGTKKSDEAQGDANKKWAEASASLAKARLEARNDNEKKLAVLEKEFTDLKPKLERKLSKAGSATIVNNLTAKSQAVRQSIDALATATADSLEPVKSTIAQRLTDFDNAIVEAKKGV
jgi:hypothetical protein